MKILGNQRLSNNFVKWFGIWNYFTFAKTLFNFLKHRILELNYLKKMS